MPKKPWTKPIRQPSPRKKVVVEPVLDAPTQYTLRALEGDFLAEFIRPENIQHLNQGYFTRSFPYVIKIGSKHWDTIKLVRRGAVLTSDQIGEILHEAYQTRHSPWPEPKPDSYVAVQVGDVWVLGTENFHQAGLLGWIRQEVKVALDEYIQDKRTELTGQLKQLVWLNQTPEDIHRMVDEILTIEPVQES